MFAKLKPHFIWFLLSAVGVAFAVLYLVHLFTGYAPPRAAFTMPVLNLPVYWYGICIVGGVALGTALIARLAQQRADTVFATAVPTTVSERPLTTLNLPEAILHKLALRQLHSLGDLLRQWGYSPRTLGLNPEELRIVNDVLNAEPDVDAAWLADAPWRIWNPDHAWNGLIWCMILALIGARLYHVLTPPPSMAAVGITSPMDYFRNPGQLLNFRSGGLGIYGGLAGGALGLWLYTRRQRIPTLVWSDLGVIAVALGQAIGRWGNFFNQELYGRPTSLPWAVQIEPVYRLSGYESFAAFHPAFLYESLWSLASFFLLWRLYRRHLHRLRRGDLTALYLVLYAVGRSLLELVRLDSRTLHIGSVDTGLAVATIVSLVVAVCMALLLAWRHRGQSTVTSEQ